MIHLSLDGCTAGPDDELDWIYYDSELESYAHSLHEQVDTVIWGRRTYEGMAGYWLTVPTNPESTEAEREHARWLDSVTKVVVSTTLESAAWGSAGKTLLIRDNLAQAITQLRQLPGKNMWVLGSPVLMQSMMTLDLIDEYRININPCVLGRGKKLFTDAAARHMPLKLAETRRFASGVVGLVYTRA
jgi:dihydrofolate reductase